MSASEPHQPPEPPIHRPRPASPPPAASVPPEPQNGAQEPPSTPPEPERAPLDPRTQEALLRIASTVEGLQTELELVRKKLRGNERQLIMTFGVLALILWKLNAPKIGQGVKDVLVPES